MASEVQSKEDWVNEAREEVVSARRGVSSEEEVSGILMAATGAGSDE